MAIRSKLIRMNIWNFIQNKGTVPQYQQSIPDKNDIQEYYEGEVISH